MCNTVLGALCLSSAATIWGALYVVSKYVLDFIPPLTLVWLRYSIAFVFLYIILKIVQRKTDTPTKFDRGDWLLLAWIGFVGYFLSISCQFIGTKLSDAHTGALITSATPAFTVIFARFVLQETLTVRKFLSLIIATFGVAIIIGWNSNLGYNIWGYVFLVAAAITWALLSVYVKLASYKFSTLTITTYAILFAVIFTTPFMIWELQTSRLIFNNYLVYWGVLYIGIVATAFAYLLWNKGMELMDAGIGSLFFFFQPVMGSFLGWLWLDEHLDLNFFIGGVLILLGVLLVTVPQKRNKALTVKDR
ncbi:putative inner membrane transporter yiJE [Sporotomaculum syntrophicum]|uniref:Inner membrane transporter yiJE n=1 Tax=Sporotomaculum syntrophicum TaxID=182264 RepID=A0A9D3AXP9_9FIRM|nr:EamA family transporter [Sporotomaculum syntrophicum]KAF1084686.1 putative inner membrane transporter yiJE [Sporotomaculum syntrophicum]